MKIAEEKYKDKNISHSHKTCMPPRHGHSLRRMRCDSASLKDKSYERFSAQYKLEKIYGE
jgi:hypothetical protein